MRNRNMPLLLFFFACLCSNVFAQVPTSGLVSWYPFNGNANDGSGNALNGVNTGATLTQDRSGSANNAFLFNGTSNYISIANDSTLSFGTGNFTVAAIIRTNIVPSGSWSAIVSKHNTSTYHDIEFNLSIQGSTGIPFFSLSNGSGYFENVFGIKNICDGMFHSVCGVRENGQIKLYIDGSLVGTATASINITNSNPINIGRSSYSNGYGYFNGTIDEVLLYNRALSASEVLSLSNNGPPSRPNNLSVTGGNTTITLKWNKITNSDQLLYRIYGGITANPTTLIDSTSASISDTIKTIKGLTNGTKYYFRVSAMDNSRLESSYSNEIVAVPSAPFLAYSSSKSGNPELYRCNADGSNEIRLSNNTASDDNPKISPNGQKIAFTSNRDGQFDVYVTSYDGTTTSRVTTTGTYGGANNSGWVGWLNDTTILYTLANKIRKVHINGTGGTDLISSANGAGIHNFDYSPSLGKITYAAQGGWAYTNTLYLVNLDGSNSQVFVADRAGLESYPAFSNDGTGIFYVYDISGHEEGSGRSLDMHLFLKKISDGSEVDISGTKTSGYNDIVNYSPNDSVIFITNGISDGSVLPSIYYMDGSGKNRTQIISSGYLSDIWPRKFSGFKPLKIGLVASYPFNGNPNDESGNGNNGTNNGASLVTDRFENSSKAYSFDGSTNSISLGNPIDIQSSLTFSGWYLFPNTASQWATLFMKSIYFPGFGVMYNNSGYFRIYNNNNSTGIGDIPYTIQSGKWMHFVLTYNGTNIAIYINNVFIGSIVYSSVITDGATLYIGKNGPPNNTYPFTGSIDDIRIYNRSISSSEVNDLYHENGWPLIPTITSFTPASGSIGTSVTITGTNFSTTTSNNIVWFGGVKATVTAATSTTLSVTVPTGSKYQPISLTTTLNGLTAYSGTPFVVTFPSSQLINAASFATKLDFSSVTAPIHAALGDIDGDGKLDLVVGNYFGGSTISVFRNTSISGSVTSGSFAAPVVFTTGSGPDFIAIGDIDGDGKQDILVSNNSSNTFSVFRNISSPGVINSGSLDAKVDFTTGSYPQGVALGDIDRDGKPDIAVTNYWSNTVSVYRNASTPGSFNTGSLASPINFSTGTNPQGEALADIDNDGKPDLIVANAGGTTISVFKNTAVSGTITSGTFTSKVDFTSGSNPTYLVVGDLDGDSKTDIAVPNSSSNSISIFRNTSTSGTINSGSFAGKVDLGTGVLPQFISIGDLDGDGKPDLAVTNGTSNTLSIFKNISTSGSITSGSFNPKIDLTTGTLPEVVLIGDIDGDGKPDLAVANNTTNNVSVYRNLITSPPPTITSFTPTSGPIGTPVTITGTNFNTIAANDIVWFGAVKAIVTAATSTQLTVTVPTGTTYQPISVTTLTNGLTAFSNSPFTVTFPSSQIIDAATFASKVDFTSGTGPEDIVISDIDGDGKVDVIVTNRNSVNVSVYRNISTYGSFTSGSFSSKVDFTGSGPQIAIGDIDGDGKPDLIVVNSTGNMVSVFRNTSTSGSITTGSFSAKVDFTTGNFPFGVSIGDIDGDGKPDIAVTNNTDNSVSVFRNISTPGTITTSSFAARLDYTTGLSPLDVLLGDLDGDGKPDLIVTNSGSSSISVFRNISTSGSISAGSFSARNDFVTGTNPYKVAIGDIDGDGKQDLAVSNTGSSSVSVLRNLSLPGAFTTSSFAARVDLTTGSNPRGVYFSDIDGDGKPDLTIANQFSWNVSVIRNISTPGTITTGSFANRVDFSTGENPYGVALGDFDGDGKPDLVLANNSANTISVLRSTIAAIPPPALGAIIQPTCSLLTGSVTLSGLPSVGTWTLTRTPGGTTITGTGTTTTISGLAAGTYNYTVTNASSETSGSSADIVINVQPVSPTAPSVGTLTQPTCTLATGSVILNGLPASGTWTLSRSPGGTTTTGIGTSSTISGLATGTYTFTVTDGVSSCTSLASGNVVINAQPATPTAPTIGIITHPSCSVANGSTELKDLPASGGTWTVTVSPGGATFTGVGSFYVLSGISSGTYSYTVTNSSGCISPASASVIINSQPITPTAPVVGTITQTTCSLLTGSVTLNGLPATGTWTVTKSPGGTTTTGTGVSSTLTGITAGTYTFSVTNTLGCLSPASSSAVINTQPSSPAAPTVGTITQPTCTISTGSVVLNGLPPTGTWTLTKLPGSTTTTGTGVSSTVPGLPAGTYSFTVTSSSGCISVSSGNVIINAAPVTATAPTFGIITQPTCVVATGSTEIKDLPAPGLWTVTTTPGGATFTGAGAFYILSGISPGTYSFTVTNSSGCTSVPTSNLLIQNAKIGVIPILTKKWNDVLICYNLNNEITTWQWFKGITPLTGESFDQFYWVRNQPGIYKVLTTDKDGCKNYSNTIQIGTGTKSLNAYPNPASENITLSLNDETNGKAVISIYNQSGTKVMEIVTEKEYPDLLKEIQVSSLNEGIYLVKVTVNLVNVYYTKIVIAK